jgi:hypothetical protein
MDIQKINEFLSFSVLLNGNGYGNGNGDGDGNGDGNGYGYGDGNGYGYGNGDGYGDGNGYGYGDGDGHRNGNGYGDRNGNGYGDGNGYGNGNGNGDGNGYGYGLKSISNQNIYEIDNIQTIIISIKQNLAKGYIVNNDLTLESCFIAKGENQFAHGKTAKEAFNSLQEKLLITLPIEQRIIKFKENFISLKKKYKAKEYFNWHYLLTGSCNMGRLSFINNNNINLEKDSFTVIEFINKVKNQYGFEIIKKLQESYKIN